MKNFNYYTNIMNNFLLKLLLWININIFIINIHKILIILYIKMIFFKNKLKINK